MRYSIRMSPELSKEYKLVSNTGMSPYLIHSEHILCRAGKSGKASFQRCKVHQVTQTSPVLVLVQQDSEGEASSIVQFGQVPSLLLDTHGLHLGAEHLWGGKGLKWGLNYAAQDSGSA